jgi:endonuclease YncB( thermonuclease family)
VSQRGVWDYTVEDADTVRLMLAGGNSMTLRLAGIDAPEIAHSDDYAFGRVNQDQPYGQEAKSRLEEILANQKNLSVLFDPNSETYGRSVGVLQGDGGQNINLQLVASGAAASLPFGGASSRLYDTGAFRRAERAAFNSSIGMWQEDSWRAVRNAQDDKKRRVTHTSLTQMGRMFENFDTASIALRMNNPDSALAEMQSSGGKDDHNIIEGLDHGWYGSVRGRNTDFGSGFLLNKGIPVLRSTDHHIKKKLISGNKSARTYSRLMMDQKNLTAHQYG